MARDELRRSAGHGVTWGQGALFCSGCNCSSQRTEKPLDTETTATLEMATVPLLGDAIFENLGDSPQFFKHFLAHTWLSICEMPLSTTGSRLGFPLHTHRS